MASVLASAATAQAAGEDAPPSPPTSSRVGGTSSAPPSPAPEVGLGAVQLAGGYVAEIGGIAGLAAIGLHAKALGFDHADRGNMILVAVAAPALAGAAVCAIGRFSRSYQGRCSTTFLGAYAGAALGLVLGVSLAGKPNPDDTVEFMQAMGGALGVLALAPIGAVVGYHLGKTPIAEPNAAAATAWPEAGGAIATAGFESPRDSFTVPSVRRLMLPLISLVW